MIYWYRDLMLDDILKHGADRHKLRVERYYRGLPKSKAFSEKKRWWEQFIGKKIPWIDYVVVMRASNPDNLFEVMGVRQWILRHYERTDIYVIGLFVTEFEALFRLETMLADGYEADENYDPRAEFENPDDYEVFTVDEVLQGRAEEKTEDGER